MYDTWEHARTVAEKLEKIEGDIKIIQSSIEWSDEYTRRLRVKLGELQEEFDSLAELRLKHR